jgi:hypothetical protein
MENKGTMVLEIGATPHRDHTGAIALRKFVVFTFDLHSNHGTLRDDK